MADSGDVVGVGILLAVNLNAFQIILLKQFHSSYGASRLVVVYLFDR